MAFKKKKTDIEDLTSRQAVLWLSPMAVVKFMTSQRWVIVNGNLPDDTQFHHVFYDASRQLFGLVCMSKEFRSLKMGERMPDLPEIEMRYYDPNMDGAI